ncbi:MAG: non-homologous end-joining DNA ligase [Acidimicrobiia bacterium]|nr:non-homologous end-joining DNA ligase [Acidimicrobiia bacterium]
MATSPERTAVTIEGHRLVLSNLSKVLYPAAGFHKAEVIDYYVRVAPAMLAHIADRAVTLRRYPDGPDGESFFEKRCPSHRPEWVPVALGPGDRRGAIAYCRLDSVAALAWAANLAALEIHAPMARCDDIESPTMVVFDLDPGLPATITECCEAALEIAEVLDAVGLRAWPKTSGSKGLQLYVPINGELSHERASSFAHAVAQLLERKLPARITSNMDKAQRGGRVFIDWSQNSRHKTTVAAYSLRARERPTVSTPVSWDEVSDGATGTPLAFEAAEVLDRLDRLGDLFAAVTTVRQQLPGGS